MSNHTLTHLSNRWPNFDMESHVFTTIRVDGQKKVETSRSGGGMVLLTGLEVKINGKWVAAHLSFPPDSSGTGVFSEGHLKIESGNLLNQYFFSCDDNDTWEVEKLSNSPTVKTKNPGKWSNIPGDLWRDLEVLVTHLAYL